MESPRIQGVASFDPRKFRPVNVANPVVVGTAALLYSVVGTCKHLSVDPFAYLREGLPGLFALGEKPTTEQLLDWLPDRWLLNRTRNTSIAPATAG